MPANHAVAVHVSAGEPEQLARSVCLVLRELREVQEVLADNRLLKWRTTRWRMHDWVGRQQPDSWGEEYTPLHSACAPARCTRGTDHIQFCPQTLSRRYGSPLSACTSASEDRDGTGMRGGWRTHIGGHFAVPRGEVPLAVAVLQRGDGVRHEELVAHHLLQADEPVVVIVQQAEGVPRGVATRGPPHVLQVLLEQHVLLHEGCVIVAGPRQLLPQQVRLPNGPRGVVHGRFS
eukprot:1183952-Prorocentrum_minimum.AAC.1